MCFFAVTLWFILKLKRDSIWATWIEFILNPIVKLAVGIIMGSLDWLGTGVKGVLTGVNWTWKKACDKAKPNLRTQRNIFWYFYSLLFNPEETDNRY